jgi:hypothetical protein
MKMRNGNRRVCKGLRGFSIFFAQCVSPLFYKKTQFLTASLCRITSSPMRCTDPYFVDLQIVQRAFYLFQILLRNHKHILPFTALKNKNKAK